MVGFLSCQCTLLAQIELLICHHPQVFLLRATVNSFSAQPAFVLGIALIHMQDLALGLVELHEVSTDPPLKPVNNPLDGFASLQHVDCSTQLGVIGTLAEGALNPTIHVTNKGVKEYHSPEECHSSLVSSWTPSHQLQLFSVAIQPLPYRVSGPSVKSMSLQFRDQDVMQDSIKCFAQVHVDVLSCSSLIHQHSNPVIEGHQIF
ncbi:hypothetical protein llap_6739 [Limosa lapponica baueri]|uniref:Uncharacterized protein n=1 Tax=Limosa lapponica baueri TaxID=1758121 RepID=A0A2I0UA90_LIMLA|nr:hypothetical protein llap_6739 [Limosa lapponica baueri]